MQISYTNFVVPETLAFRYICIIGLVLVGLPYFFGYRLTMLGATLNFFWADYLFYRWFKTKLMVQEYFKEQERQQKWRRDNGEDDD